MGQRYIWAEQADEATVERFIGAVQRAVADALPPPEVPDGWRLLPAPEIATALLTVLASVVEQAPECATPRGMRLTAEALGRDLLGLMKEVRGLREAEHGRAH